MTPPLNFTNMEQFEAARLLAINHLLDAGGDAPAGSEMSPQERLYLNGVIRRARPRKIVELGVAAGGSACIILNAIRDVAGSTLDSIDYTEQYYRDPAKKTGWMVAERLPELAEKWRLFTGGMACRHLDEITAGGREKIDLCLIDTVHSNPGEFLNILEVLPYMTAGGIILLHDVNLHTMLREDQYTNCVLLAALNGERIPAAPEAAAILPNIGGVVLGDLTDDRHWRLFSLLTLPWQHMISDADHEALASHFARHYRRELVEIYTRSFAFHRQRLADRRRVSLLGFTLGETWKDARHRHVSALGMRFHFRR